MKKLTKDLFIKIRDVKDLFVAPTQDPLSNYEYIQSGEAAFARAIRLLNTEKNKTISTIDICLPDSTIQSITIPELRRMIHYYLHFQLKDNNQNLILFKNDTKRILCNAIIFLFICMAIVTILGIESFIPHLPPLMRSVLVEGFTVIGWVVMWRPIELILNQWTALKIEEKVYKKLLKAEIKLSYQK